MKTAADMPTDVEELQEALRISRLKVDLLEAMIDILDEQFGTDIRKKLAPVGHEGRTKPGCSLSLLCSLSGYSKFCLAVGRQNIKQI